jgi:hypothetical protein
MITAVLGVEILALDMRIDLRGSEIGVAKQLLHGT